MHSRVSPVSRVVRRLALALLLVCAAAGPAAAEHFTINHFHADIEIQQDRTIHVTERIELTFERARHGIFRSVPYKYIDALGNRQRSPVSILSVTDDRGRERPHKVGYRGNVVEVRIGHPDRYVDGRQVYVISYEVENILLFLEDRDELYWNVTGTYWEVPIDSTSATVRLTTDRQPTTLHAACYSGYRSSRERDCTAEVAGGEALFRSTRGLAPNEGLTIAVGWDKDIIAPPSEWEQTVYDYNLGSLWVFIIPLVVFVLMFYLWRTKGRDPVVHESVTVRYEPPKVGDKVLTPAEVGTMIDERVDPRDLSAAIVGLATKGYLEIHETKDEKLLGLIESTDYELRRKKDADSNLTEFEQYLFSKLFPANVRTQLVSEMKNKFYRYLPHLHKLMYKGLTLKGFFKSSPAHVRKTYAVFGVTFLALSVPVVFFLASADFVFPLIALVLSGVIILLFARAMPAKTRTGVVALDQIRGFQEFMMRADKDRIERLGASILYEYMPYAIALDVTDQWAKAFAGLSIEPPSWYHGGVGLHTFSAVAFAQSLNTATSKIGSASYSSPRGSGGGSGGGGFSGGGGGGGGGGSW